MPKPSEIWKTFVHAIDEFIADDCVTLAAALAYYSVFSLPPLLFLIAAIAGSLLGWGVIEAQLVASIQGVTGEAVAEQLRQGLRSFGPRLKPDSLMILGTMAVLLFAATGVLVQLQNALNRAWGVRHDPQRGYVRALAAKRVLSLGMIVILTAVMLVSVVISTVVTAAGKRISLYLPQVFSDPMLHALDLAAGCAVFFVAFAAVFRILPDAEIEWRDVWIGSGVTAALLSIGKFGVALYLGSRDVGETFGPAAALAVLLLWIYYSSMIVLFGAEFTQCWARRKGRWIVPSEGAQAVIKGHAEESPASAEETGRA